MSMATAAAPGSLCCSELMAAGFPAPDAPHAAACSPDSRSSQTRPTARPVAESSSSPDEIALPSARRPATASRRLCLGCSDSSPEQLTPCRAPPQSARGPCRNMIEVPVSHSRSCATVEYADYQPACRAGPAEISSSPDEIPMPSANATQHLCQASEGSPEQLSEQMPPWPSKTEVTVARQPMSDHACTKGCISSQPAHKPGNPAAWPVAEISSSPDTSPLRSVKRPAAASRRLCLDSDSSPEQLRPTQASRDEIGVPGHPDGNLAFMDGRSVSQPACRPGPASPARWQVADIGSSPDAIPLPSARRPATASRQLYLDSDSSPEQLRTQMAPKPSQDQVGVPVQPDSNLASTDGSSKSSSQPACSHGLASPARWPVAEIGSSPDSIPLPSARRPDTASRRLCLDSDSSPEPSATLKAHCGRHMPVVSDWASSPRLGRADWACAADMVSEPCSSSDITPTGSRIHIRAPATDDFADPASSPQIRQRIFRASKPGCDTAMAEPDSSPESGPCTVRGLARAKRCMQVLSDSDASPAGSSPGSADLASLNEQLGPAGCSPTFLSMVSEPAQASGARYGMQQEAQPSVNHAMQPNAREARQSSPETRLQPQTVPVSTPSPCSSPESIILLDDDNPSCTSQHSGAVGGPDLQMGSPFSSGAPPPRAPLVEVIPSQPKCSDRLDLANCAPKPRNRLPEGYLASATPSCKPCMTMGSAGGNGVPRAGTS